MLIRLKMVFLIAILSTVTSQCAIKLATSLKVNNTIISEMIRSCCSATGIICNPNNEVVQIHWGNMGLIGFIDESAMPFKLKILSLKDNKISGNIPSDWPVSLSVLNLENNMITGTILKLPPQSRLVYLSNNRFFGVLPDLPSTLVEFYINGNKLKGNIPSLPNVGKLRLGYINSFGNTFSGVLHLSFATEVFINGNDVTDVILDDPSLLKICDISGNPLLNSAHLSDFKTCTKSGLTAPNAAADSNPIQIQSGTPAPFNLDQTKNTKESQSSVDASRASGSISNTTIAIIVSSFLLFFALIAAIYYIKRKNNQKKQDSECNTAPMVSVIMTELDDDSRYTFYTESDVFNEPISRYSVGTNSAFFSNYYGTIKSTRNK